MAMYKRYHAGFSTVEVIIVIIVLALACFGGWYVLSKQKSVEKHKTATATAEQKPVDVKELVGGIKTAVGDTYQMVSQEDIPDYSWYIDYSAEGYKFKTRASGDAHVMFTDKASWPIDARAKPIPAGVRQAVAQGIKDRGGVALTDPPIDVKALYGSFASVNYYSFKNAVCVTTEDKENATIYTLNCANLEDFVGVAKAAEPFDSYISQAQDIKVEDLILAAPEVQPSATAGYEYATEVFVSPKLSAMAYFYHKTGEQDWHYFKVSQEGLGCEQLAGNADATAAFSTICQTGGH